MRYVEITHTYVLPVPADDVDVIEPLAREGMSIMEGFMKARADNIQRIRSDWKMLPREYVPETIDEVTFTPAKAMTKEEFGALADRAADREEAKRQIEADTDQGISFAGDVMGQSAAKVTHPWDQGLRVFPLDGSPMSLAETEALRQEGMLCPASNEGHECHCVKGHSGPHQEWTKEITS